MDKNKINIDQYFKNALQNHEGNADEGMFDEIKKKLDDSKISVDDYFKNAMFSFEANAEDLSFDAIKSKIDTPKITIDSYFKEALLDYNSNAGSIPFSDIQNKLDRERVVDNHFKDALQNYEGNAHDAEFALIRNRILKLQNERRRKRYAWLFIILLIPVAYIANNLLHTSPPVQSEIAVNEPLNNDQNIPNENNRSELSSSDKNIIPKVNSKANNLNGKSTTETNVENPVPSQKSNQNHTENNNTVKEGGNSSNNNSTPTDQNAVNIQPDGTNTQVVPTDTKDANNPDNLPNTNKVNSSDVNSKQPKTKPTKTNLHKPKSKLTIEFYWAASLNNRYLNSEHQAGQYFITRAASDKQTTRHNFGLNIFKKVNKFNFGFGLNESQFGQKGTYHLNKELYDSIPLWDPTHTYIKGYFAFNYRDTSFNYDYNNYFTQVEVPLHISYTLCKAKNWDFETGASLLFTYIANVTGAMPNANSSDIIQLKEMKNQINRFGSSVSVNMKMHYNLTSHWQLGSDIYLKSNINSIYKKQTGITELPYSFGLRWGIGYKF